MIEVEVKAWICDFDDIKRKLDKIGAKKIKTEHQEDTYFNAPHRDFAKTDEALRIRKTSNDETKRTFITYKGPKIDKVSKTRKEVEVGVENAENAAQILENLGFHPVATIRKIRDVYFLDKFIICLDDVHTIGNFVEIEKRIKEGKSFNKIVNEILKIYKKLGITEGFERRSYLELLGIYKS